MVVLEYSEILEVVTQTIKDEFGVEDYFDETYSITEDLQLDSLDCIDLLAAMEKKYEVSLDGRKQEKAFYKACRGTVQDITLFFLEAITEVKNGSSR